MDRAVCIHGHFYQPSRENPWFGDVEVQRSAAPYHDWNERVTEECYRPNTAARILDEEGRIAEVVNTYSRISFTAAPTLLSWLERHHPAVYRAILDGDRKSRERYGGHGSAIACCYNHIIMPLAAPRDRRSQVVWGVRDFAARFGREPEGMWLPETAVDIESLELMAGAGIRFTILAPHQAGKVRAIGAKEWTDVSGGHVETRMPYICRLPSGRSIAVFFYNGRVSRDVAFGDLLSDGQRFARRLLNEFSRGEGRTELVHIATDGETYGHHRKFGEMALACCLRAIEARDDARLTVYGEYLAAHPPTHEVVVREGTSWSCTHGIGRWQRECGCHSGAHPGWSQAWREPLREAVVMVRDALAPRSEEVLATLVRNPAAVRDDAVNPVIARWSDDAVDEFLSRHVAGDITPDDRQRILSLLEIERQAMLMQTSCGWFFDDITEPGSVQVMRHAARAMDLARRTLDLNLEEAFIEILTRAPVNDPEYATGAAVYETPVRSAAMDPVRVGAGAALYHLFDLESPAVTSGMYAVEADWRHRMERAGRHGLAGTVRVRSRATGDRVCSDAVALFAGMDRIILGVREPGGDAALQKMWEEATGAGIFTSFSGIVTSSGLTDEERWAIARRILPGVREAVSAVYREAEALIRVLDDLGIPEPGPVSRLREQAGNERLLVMIEEGCTDPGWFTTFTGEMMANGLRLDLRALGDSAGRQVLLSLQKAAERPGDPAPLEEVARIVRCAKEGMLPLTIWESQNACIAMLGRYEEMRQRAERGDGNAEAWTDAFRRAAECLGVRVR